MITVDAPQGSLEWLHARLGIPTASRFADAIARGKGGAPTQRRTTYLAQLVAERVSGVQPQFVTPAMQRGLEEEPNVVAAYQAARPRRHVEYPAPLMLTDDGAYGATPDALVDDVGLLEVKTLAPAKYIAGLLQAPKLIAEQWLAQLHGQLLVTGRQWVDVATRCTELDAMVIERIHRPQRSVMTQFDAELREFVAELDAAEALVLDHLSEQDATPAPGAVA